MAQKDIEQSALENKDLHWKDDRRRADQNALENNFILQAILVFLLLVANVLCVCLAERMTAYTFETPEAALGEQIPVQSREEPFLVLWTLEDGSTLAAEKHFIWNRWQAAEEKNGKIKGDTFTVTLANTLEEAEVKTTSLNLFTFGLPDRLPVMTLIYGLVLLIPELTLWFLLRRARR